MPQTAEAPIARWIKRVGDVLHRVPQNPRCRTRSCVKRSCHVPPGPPYPTIRRAAPEGFASSRPPGDQFPMRPLLKGILKGDAVKMFFCDTVKIRIRSMQSWMAF